MLKISFRVNLTKRNVPNT